MVFVTNFDQQEYILEETALEKSCKKGMDKVSPPGFEIEPVCASYTR